MLDRVNVPEFIGYIVSSLAKYDANWEVYTVGTTCCNEPVNGMTNPYVVSLRNKITGDIMQEYIPFYREIGGV